jgi:hypothetical protein
MPRRQRGLAFECDSGKVIKVQDAVCWRHVEGRTCFPPIRKFLSANVGGAHEDGESKARVIACRRPDVVVVPIAPSVQETRGRSDLQEPRADMDHVEAVACKTYGADIVALANRAGAALSHAGLAVEVDINTKWRASQKFNDWERRSLFVHTFLCRLQLSQRNPCRTCFHKHPLTYWRCGVQRGACAY